MRHELTRWDPFDDLREMQRWMDRMMRNFPNVQRQDVEVGGIDEALALDIFEKDDQVVVKAALPGVDPMEIDVNVKDGILHIRAETKAEQDVKEGDYLRHEYRYGRFARSLRLPPNVDATKAQAKFEHGMLRLSFPKTEPEKAKAHKIEVKGAEGLGEQQQPQIEGATPPKGVGGKGGKAPQAT